MIGTTRARHNPNDWFFSLGLTPSSLARLDCHPYPIRRSTYPYGDTIPRPDVSHFHPPTPLGHRRIPAMFYCRNKNNGFAALEGTARGDEVGWRQTVCAKGGRADIVIRKALSEKITIAPARPTDDAVFSRLTTRYRPTA